ncbi:MAG: hypothetical protein QGI83_04635 [Candidatus Latescibacteria bacterium]|nr:hypothetical protein [Candidatus Latescibacterota bacterium]
MTDYRPNGDLVLDFEDLVEELDQFEKDAEQLKDRIAGLIDDAKVLAGGDGTPEGVETGPSTLNTT